MTSFLENYFNSISASYSNKPILTPVKRLELSQIVPRLPALFGLDVLEVGCGHGLYTKHLISKSPNSLTVNDLSEKMIKSVPFNVNQKIVGDFLNLDLENRSYDVIFCFGAVEFIGLAQFLEKCHSLLKKNGEVFFLYPNRNFVGLCYRYWYKKRHIDIKIYSNKLLKTKIEKKFSIKTISKVYPLNHLVILKHES